MYSKVLRHFCFEKLKAIPVPVFMPNCTAKYYFFEQGKFRREMHKDSDEQENP